MWYYWPISGRSSSFQSLFAIRNVHRVNLKFIIYVTELICIDSSFSIIKYALHVWHIFLRMMHTRLPSQVRKFFNFKWKMMRLRSDVCWCDTHDVFSLNTLRVCYKNVYLFFNHKLKARSIYTDGNYLQLRKTNWKHLYWSKKASTTSLCLIDLIPYLKQATYTIESAYNSEILLLLFGICGISAIQPLKFRNHRIRISHAIRELIRFASSHLTTMVLMPERIRL